MCPAGGTCCSPSTWSGTVPSGPIPEFAPFYTRPMSIACPAEPVSTIDQAVEQMRAIAAALPADDGVACFNRMYLGVTEQVGSRISVGFFETPAFMETTDVQFANLYFEAVAAPPGETPLAWRPLVEAPCARPSPRLSCGRRRNRRQVACHRAFALTVGDRVVCAHPRARLG